jgi:regulator of protease activity HflC (stomatin/prohibitin superfamily)
MFDKLIEILQLIWESLIPWVVLMPYEQGVHLRLGTPIRDLKEPGFYWCLPFHLDVVLKENVVPRTSRLSGLSTTTIDGHSIGFDAVITWSIANVRKALLEVNDLDDAIADTCAGIIGTQLADAEWSAVWHGKATEDLANVCRKRGWKWGVEVHSVQLVGVAKVRNLRISTGGEGAKHTHFHGGSLGL